MSNLRTVAWDIDQAAIAVNNGDGTFGTVLGLRGIVTLTFNVRVKSAEQMGGGQIFSVMSKVIGGGGTISFADHQEFAVMSILTGAARESSGSTIISQALGGEYMPWFALWGRTYLEDAVGTYEIFVPRVKITSDFAVGFADNAFVIPEIQFTAVPDPNVTRSSVPKVLVQGRRSAAVAVTTFPPIGMPVS